MAGVVAGGIVVAIGLAAAPFSGGVSLAAVVAGLKLAGATVIATVGTGLAAGYITKQCMPNDFYLPLYKISPEEIFSGEVLLFDVNFFNPKAEATETLENGQVIKQESSAAKLQGVISKWYFTIRNFSIVALLSILVYIGIRIIISSTAQDKAKYKQRLLDWIIAMCMLFFLHYIMAFAITVTELITDSLAKKGPSYVAVFTEDTLKDYHWDFKQQVYKYYHEDKEVTDEEAENLKQQGEDVETRKEDITIDSAILKDEKDGVYKAFEEAGIIGVDDDGKKYLAWPTNLMGKARIDAQLELDGEEGDNTAISQFANTMIFVALVMYTILFVFRYLKRLLMLAFLTIIAPFVAMTYPLDKMGDGSAQAFNMWLKEYLYNLLIQPVHLVLYTVLIGTAFEFAVSNPLYTLVALGFMLQAEKIMRKFFGFEKASTVAGGSALGGAMAMQAINSLRKIGGPKRGKGGAGGKGTNGAVEGNEKIKMADRKADDGKDIGDLLDDGDSEGKSGALPASGLENSLDKTSEDGNRIKDAKALYGADMIDKEAFATAKEQDTRGMGQWIYDAYQGSNLQEGVNKFGNAVYNSKPVKFTRKIGGTLANGARGVRDLARKGIRKVPKPIRNTFRGAASVAGKGLAYATPKIGKAAAKATLTGAGALYGAAAGLVSDDFSNTLKWGAAGAGAGWAGTDGIIAAGKGIGSTASGAVDTIQNGIETAASTYTLQAHGSEAEEKRQKEKADKDAMRNADRRKEYAEKLKLKDKAAIQEAMKQAQTYRESGITDDDLIIKAMKAKSFNSERDSRERIITAGLAEKAKNNGQDVEKNLDYIKGQLSEKGINKKDIDKYITGIKEINKWKI